MTLAAPAGSRTVPGVARLDAGAPAVALQGPGAFALVGGSQGLATPVHPAQVSEIP